MIVLWRAIERISGDFKGELMKWISVNTHKPKLGQKCYCFYVIERTNGMILKDTRLLYYLKCRWDNRKRCFSDKDNLFFDMNIGRTSWPVTHWMPEPEYPNVKSGESQEGEDDQKRTVTPKEAIVNGADLLVIGRPILSSNNIVDSLKRTNDEINII